MKQFTCDSCAKTFPNALDEEIFKDEHGNWHTFDLCAPCRAKMNKVITGDKFFNKLLEEK